MRLESRREDTSPIFGARVARQRDRGEKAFVFSFILPNLSDHPYPSSSGRPISVTRASGRSTSSI